MAKVSEKPKFLIKKVEEAGIKTGNFKKVYDNLNTNPEMKALFERYSPGFSDSVEKVLKKHNIIK